MKNKGKILWYKRGCVRIGREKSLFTFLTNLFDIIKKKEEFSWKSAKYL